MSKIKTNAAALKPRRKRRNIKDLRTMTAAGARSQFSEIVNRTAFGGERVVVTRRGKPLAALVPIDDLALLEELRIAWMRAISALRSKPPAAKPPSLGTS